MEEKIRWICLMINWKDLNDDGQIDNAERMFAAELLCTSREEHMAIFGDNDDFMMLLMTI